MDVNKIKIPKRIERGPTDILYALSRTVGRDPTANHYKYPDDPHIDANSINNKQNLALALESGRKAAWWVVEKNKNLFQHKVADPPIEAFIPKYQYNKETVSEDVLLDVINKTEVSVAIDVYELLTELQIGK